VAETKHTPGPWVTNGWTSHGMVISVAKDAEGIGCGKYIGYAQGYPHPDDHEVDMPTAEANARLMAAAPDMLEELEGIHVWLDEGPEREQIRLLIRKATGER
jgi:hypothetical protein